MFRGVASGNPPEPPAFAVPPAGEPDPWVTARVHVGGATQVPDPVLVKNQKAVPNRHPNEGIARPGLRAIRHWDVFFDIHAYSVQQVHGQHEYKAFPFKFSLSVTYSTRLLSFISRKKSRARILC